MMNRILGIFSSEVMRSMRTPFIVLILVVACRSSVAGEYNYFNTL